MGEKHHQIRFLEPQLRTQIDPPRGTQSIYTARHKASLAAEFFPQLSTILGIKIEQTQQIKISLVTDMKQN